jgi:hypothetical protein
MAVWWRPSSAARSFTLSKPTKLAMVLVPSLSLTASMRWA